jgi:hypothetical protein
VPRTISSRGAELIVRETSGSIGSESAPTIGMAAAGPHRRPRRHDAEPATPRSRGQPTTFTVAPLRRLSFAASASTSAARPSANPGSNAVPCSIPVTKASISAR